MHVLGKWAKYRGIESKIVPIRLFQCNRRLHSLLLSSFSYTTVVKNNLMVFTGNSRIKCMIACIDAGFDNLGSFS